MSDLTDTRPPGFRLLPGAMACLLLCVGCTPPQGRPNGNFPDAGSSPPDAGWSTADAGPSVGALRYFGFTAVDCDYDDPLDSSPKRSYLDEVSEFSNVAHVCVTALDMHERLRATRAMGMRAVLQVEPLLFETVPGTAPSGANERLALRPDAAQRWATFANAHADVLTEEYVAALYIADEPIWNGASPADIEAACDLVAASAGSVPLMLLEAYAVLDAAVFPRSVSWIGFDRYEVPDPLHSSLYLSDLATVRARRTRPDQQLIMVLEAKWLPYYGQAGVPPEQMADVGWSYFELAKREPDVVGMIGYIWPGGLDTPDQLGARNLPQSVREAYREMGKRIVGR